MQPIWKYLPAELAHELAPIGLSLYSSFQENFAESLNGNSADFWNWQSFEWRGLHFRNRLGIAGGLDKNAELLQVWPNLGVGFIEVGTITPKPQNPNLGSIIGRDWEKRNLWNKMGFPSAGMNEVKLNLAHAHRQTQIPIFANIGKNRTTPNEKAFEDYKEVALAVRDLVDGFVINVSSPNTTGLRSLQNKDDLKILCTNVIKIADGKPVLLKLSPDLTLSELEVSLLSALETGISGFVLTNTTTSRPNDCPFPKEGGLSGADLKALSLNSLKTSLKILGPKRRDLLIISAGGVLTPEDIQERLSLGADLVQIYSVLVFKGPAFFKQAARHMKRIPS